MSRGEDQKRVVLSVLDRLLDDEPGHSSEAPLDDSLLLRHTQQAIRRDLQDLLNSRIRCVPWNPEWKELPDSLLNYGLPDFTAAGMDAASNPDKVLESIRQTIERWEPRLSGVRIRQTTDNSYFNRVIKFRIEATMMINEKKHVLFYESVLEATTGQFDVK